MPHSVVVAAVVVAGQSRTDQGRRQGTSVHRDTPVGTVRLRRTLVVERIVQEWHVASWGRGILIHTLVVGIAGTALLVDVVGIGRVRVEA